MRKAHLAATVASTNWDLKEQLKKDRSPQSASNNGTVRFMQLMVASDVEDDSINLLKVCYT